MDRRVKERLVGASILAVLVVLIVPELLSGPASAPKIAPDAAEAMRNVTVDLATRKPTTPSVQSQADEGGPQAPPAVRTPPSVVTMPAAIPPSTAARAAPDKTPPPLETSSASPTSAPPAPSAGARRARGWTVQLGLFASRANAERLAHEVKAQGFAAYVSPTGPASNPRYRVRIGPLADRDAAAGMQSKLKSLGHSGSLAPPGS